MVLHLGLFFYNRGYSCQENLRATWIPLQLLFPLCTYFKSKLIFGSIECINCFQNFTAFQDAFQSPLPRCSLPRFHIEFSFREKTFSLRVSFELSLVSVDFTRNWIRPCKKHWRPWAWSWLCSDFFFVPPMASIQASGITLALINSLKAYLYHVGVCLWVVSGIYMQLPLSFSWVCVQY